MFHGSVGVSKPWGIGQEASEGGPAPSPHVALRAKPAGLLSWASGGRRVGGLVGGRTGLSPSPTWLSWTVDAGREEACMPQIFYLLYPHL